MVTIESKVVVITGGTSGIGEALVWACAARGAKVVFTGRNEAKLTAMGTRLEEMGVEYLALQCDVALEEDNARMASETVAKFGGIDVLINNAGHSMRALFEDVQTEVMRTLVDINLMGTMYATHYCLPHIIEAKGSIVGVSSINGLRAIPARSVYCATKFGMNGFLESLRTEMMYRGVNVIIACPGFTKSQIRERALTADGSPQGDTPRDEDKMMTAEAVAEDIIRAIEKRKRHLIMTRLGRLVVFLNKWLPGWMDKKVYQRLAQEKNSPFK